MSSQLSSDELTSLQPVLASLAHLIAGGFALDEQEIEKLLDAADIERSPARVQELGRASRILQAVRETPNDRSRQVAVASLQLRGWLEAPARAAVFIAVGPSPKPQPDPVTGPLKVTPARLEWTVAPGQTATAQIQVEGGPGRVICDSDQITVTPTEFGADVSCLQVIARPASGAPLLWASITLETKTDSAIIPVVAQWQDQATGTDAPRVQLPIGSSAPRQSTPGPAQERVLPRAAIPSASLTGQAVTTSQGSSRLRRLIWTGAIVLIAVTVGMILLFNSGRSRITSPTEVAAESQKSVDAADAVPIPVSITASPLPDIAAQTTMALTSEPQPQTPLTAIAPTHAASATPTETARPTATPTVAASVTPTLSPTSIPTSTPAVSGLFSKLWQRHQVALGAPLKGNTNDRSFAPYTFGEMAFEGGHMFFYAGPPKRIWVVYGSQRGDWTGSGTWKQYPETWNEGDPEFSCPQEADYPRQPKWGFGLVWCKYPEVRAGLKWGLEGARDIERESPGSKVYRLQEFEHGFIFRDSDGWTNGLAYVFLDNGSFVRENYK